MCSSFWSKQFVRILYVPIIIYRILHQVGDNMCRNNKHIVNININGTNGYVFGKDENWLTYSRYELYYLKHRVDNNKEYLQIPGTTWGNIRRYRINKKRTRRGCRGGKPKLRLNMGLHTKNLVNITTVTENL